MGFDVVGKACMGCGIFTFCVGVGYAYMGYTNTPDVSTAVGDTRKEMSDAVKANGASGTFQIMKTTVMVGDKEMVNEIEVSTAQFCGVAVAGVTSCPQVVITNIDTKLPLPCVANPSCQCAPDFFPGNIRFHSMDHGATICTIDAPVIGNYSYETKECLPIVQPNTTVAVVAAPTGVVAATTAVVGAPTGVVAAPTVVELFGSCSGNLTEVSIVATNRQLAAAYGAGGLAVGLVTSAVDYFRAAGFLLTGFSLICWTVLCYECCGVCTEEKHGDHDGFSDDEIALNTGRLN